MSVALVLTAGLLISIGVYLLLQRVLTRIIVGLVLLAHGANLLLLAAGGGAGEPPFVGDRAPVSADADPLPQALALTAIVISFGMLVFLLAIAFRSWALTGDDEVEDDIEDRRIAAGDDRAHDHADDHPSDRADNRADAVEPT